MCRSSRGTSTLCHRQFWWGNPSWQDLYAALAPQNGETVHPGHHRQLNKQLHDNLVMFRSFFDAMSPEYQCTVPFLTRRGVRAADISFFVDVAGTTNLGFGCCYGNRWAQGAWCDTPLFQNNFNPNIALLELYAIFMAVENWSHRNSRFRAAPALGQ